MAGAGGQQQQPQMMNVGQQQAVPTFGSPTAIGQASVPGAIMQSMGQAAQTASQATNYQPQNVQAAMAQAQGYDAAQASAERAMAERAAAQGYEATAAAAQGYEAERAAAERAAAQGYGAERIAGVGPVTAERVAAGQLAGTNLDPYFNPYETQVVQQSLQDIERQRLMQQNLGAAQAEAAGAYGGSRSGIAAAETNRAFAEQAARTAAGLRQAGFTQAQQAAQTDIQRALQANLANQATGLQAATTTANLGQQAQLANQAAANQAAQFGAQSQNVAALQNAQLGTQAALANQAAANQASQFGAQAQNVAALQNAAAQNQAAQFGAQAQNVAALQNAQLGTQTAQQNAQLGTQTALANAAAQNQAGQFGAAAQNQAALANQQTAMQAQLANQQAGLQGQQARLSAANQLANTANLGFGMVRDVRSDLAAAGAQQQAVQQALINAAQQQYAGYTGAPQQALQTQLGAFAGSQTGEQTQTATRQPGLFDYLSLGATAAASDRRLKENIRQVGMTDRGINLYRWDWNDEGRRVAGNQEGFGVIAQEVKRIIPEAISMAEDGYLRVDYTKIFPWLH